MARRQAIIFYMSRSLSRGLQILALLNKRDSSSVAELVRELNIPRASVYRIVDTLIQDGFIYRHQSDDRLRITLNVRSLSDGFTEEAHMAAVSQSTLSQLTRRFKWPVTLATISGMDLIIRENTDHESPFATERFSIGYKLPVLATASGLCILAFMTDHKRQIFLTTLAKSGGKNKLVTHRERMLQKKFTAIQNLGYSVHHRARSRSDLTAMAVPIITSQGIVRGALTIRYARSTASVRDAVKTYVPDLQDAAKRIARRIDIHIARQKKLRSWSD